MLMKLQYIIPGASRSMLEATNQTDPVDLCRRSVGHHPLFSSDCHFWFIEPSGVMMKQSESGLPVVGSEAAICYYQRHSIVVKPLLLVFAFLHNIFSTHQYKM